MVEIVCALSAAAVWALLFVLTVVIVDRQRNTAVFCLSSVLVGYVLFYFFQVLVVKLLNLVHLLSSPALWTAYLLAAAAGFTFLYVKRGGANAALPTRKILASAGQGPLIERIVGASVAAAILGLAVFSFVAPTAVWDVQAYHMPMVASYVQNESLTIGATQDLRQVYRVNGAELQMLNIALLARSDAWMELPNILALMVSLVGVFLMAKIVLHRDALAYLAVILTMTAPQILYGSASAKNDVVFLALILGAFYWIVRIASDPETHLRERLIILALTASLAVATKVIGLNVVGTAGLVLLILVLLRRLPLRAVALYSAFTVAGVMALVGDVYWNNMHMTEVPVGIRPGEVDFVAGPANIIAAVKFYVYDLSFRRLVTEQIFEHDFSHFGYFFPFLLVFGTVAGMRQFIMSRRRREELWVLALLVVVLLLSVIIARRPIQWDQRFMIWMVPAFAILAVSNLDKAHRPTLLALVAFGSAFCMLNVIQIVTNASGGIFAKSSLHIIEHGRLPYLSDVPHEKYLYKIDGFNLLGAASGERDSVLYVGAEDTWMYPGWGRRFTRYVIGVHDSADVIRKVRSGAFAFIVVEADAAEGLRRAALGPASAGNYADLYKGENRRILQRGDVPDLESELDGRRRQGVLRDLRTHTMSHD